MNERELFIAALQHHERAERAAYLARACAADDKLRQRIEGLLEQHALAGEFLERAAVNPLHAPQREARGNEENASPGNASALERPSTGRNGPGSESASLRIGSYKLLRHKSATLGSRGLHNCRKRRCTSAMKAGHGHHSN